jgi:hypothetical protein
MTRRKTASRTHRTARRRVREPETIEEARAIILQLVPNGCRVHMFASWFDHREKGSKYSSVSYACTLYGVALSRSEIEASSPAGLVRAVYNALLAPRDPQPTPRPATSIDLIDILDPATGRGILESQSSKPPLLAFNAADVRALVELVSGETK